MSHARRRGSALHLSQAATADCGYAVSSRVHAKRPDASDDVSRAFQCVSVSRIPQSQDLNLRRPFALRQRLCCRRGASRARRYLHDNLSFCCLALPSSGCRCLRDTPLAGRTVKHRDIRQM
jgi:hypothetical protein